MESHQAAGSSGTGRADPVRGRLPRPGAAPGSGAQPYMTHRGGPAAGDGRADNSPLCLSRCSTTRRRARSTQALGGLTFTLRPGGSPRSRRRLPQFGRIALEARKSAAYLAVGAERAPAGLARVQDHFPGPDDRRGLAWAEDDYFIGTNGTGVGCPQTLINAPCAVAGDPAAPASRCCCRHHRHVQALFIRLEEHCDVADR